jgi:hypothetical protein
MIFHFSFKLGTINYLTSIRHKSKILFRNYSLSFMNIIYVIFLIYINYL